MMGYLSAHGDVEGAFGRMLKDAATHGARDLFPKWDLTAAFAENLVTVESMLVARDCGPAVRALPGPVALRHF